MRAIMPRSLLKCLVLNCAALCNIYVVLAHCVSLKFSTYEIDKLSRFSSLRHVRYVRSIFEDCVYLCTSAKPFGWISFMEKNYTRVSVHKLERTRVAQCTLREWDFSRKEFAGGKVKRGQWAERLGDASLLNAKRCNGTFAAHSFRLLLLAEAARANASR